MRHLPLDQLDAARNRGEVGQVIGNMRTLGTARQQQAGEPYWIDDIVGTGLPGQELIVICANHHADWDVGSKVAYG